MEAQIEGWQHEQWQKAVYRCQDMLDRIAVIINEHPPTWKNGMIRYWSERLEQLLEQEPPYNS